MENEDIQTALINDMGQNWYGKGQLQYLTYRILHMVLPPVANADVGLPSETHAGVMIADQKPWKDALDQLLTQQGDFIRDLKVVTAYSSVDWLQLF